MWVWMSAPSNQPLYTKDTYTLSVSGMCVCVCVCVCVCACVCVCVCVCVQAPTALLLYRAKLLDRMPQFPSWSLAPGSDAGPAYKRGAEITTLVFTVATLPLGALGLAVVEIYVQLFSSTEPMQGAFWSAYEGAKGVLEPALEALPQALLQFAYALWQWRTGQLDITQRQPLARSDFWARSRLAGRYSSRALGPAFTFRKYSSPVRASEQARRAATPGRAAPRSLPLAQSKGKSICEDSARHGL